MQNMDNALNVHGIDHGLSFQRAKRIGIAGIVSIAFEIGYPIRTTNIATPAGLERSERLIVKGIKYPRKIPFPIMVAINIFLLMLF
jgi:hypothetical protein